MSIRIDDLIGIPFVDKGRTIKGADCWGAVMIVYEAVKKKKLPDYGNSAFLSNLIADEIESQKISDHWLDIGEPEEGAIVLIQNHPIFVNHTGICLDKVRFAHCLNKRGFAIERLDHPLWKNRIRGFFRYVG